MERQRKSRKRQVFVISFSANGDVGGPRALSARQAGHLRFDEGEEKSLEPLVTDALQHLDGEAEGDELAGAL